MTTKTEQDKEYLHAHQLAFLLQFVEQKTVNPVGGLLAGGMLQPTGGGMFELTERGRMHIRKLLRTPVANN